MNSAIYEGRTTDRPGEPPDRGGHSLPGSPGESPTPITIGQIMERSIFRVSSSETTGRLKDAWPGQPVVVLDEEQFYNSEIILDSIPFDSYAGNDLPLAELRELMIEPMFTAANVLVEDLYQSMSFDPDIRGFLVYEKNDSDSFEVKGVASALDVFREILKIDLSIKLKVQSGSPPPPLITTIPHTDCPICYYCVDESKLYDCQEVEWEKIKRQAVCPMNINHKLKNHACPS